MKAKRSCQLARPLFAQTNLVGLFLTVLEEVSQAEVEVYPG